MAIRLDLRVKCPTGWTFQSTTSDFTAIKTQGHLKKKKIFTFFMVPLFEINYVCKILNEECSIRGTHVEFQQLVQWY